MGDDCSMDDSMFGGVVARARCRFLLPIVFYRLVGMYALVLRRRYSVGFCSHKIGHVRRCSYLATQEHPVDAVEFNPVRRLVPQRGCCGSAFVVIPITV